MKKTEHVAREKARIRAAQKIMAQLEDFIASGDESALDPHVLQYIQGAAGTKQTPETYREKKLGMSSDSTLVRAAVSDWRPSKLRTTNPAYRKYHSVAAPCGAAARVTRWLEPVPITSVPATQLCSKCCREEYWSAVPGTEPEPRNRK